MPRCFSPATNRDLLEPFAYEARDELIRLTRGQVGCRIVDRDRYGRFVGRCWSDASPDLNAAVIRSGFATEYRRYSKGLYSAAEAKARAEGRGAWAAPQPIPPSQPVTP